MAGEDVIPRPTHRRKRAKALNDSGSENGQHTKITPKDNENDISFDSSMECNIRIKKGKNIGKEKIKELEEIRVGYRMANAQGKHITETNTESTELTAKRQCRTITTAEHTELTVKGKHNI